METTESIVESAEETVESKEPMPLMPVRFQGAQYARNVWVATVPAGVTAKDTLHPGFWSLVSARMKPWDEVEIRADDESWFAKGIVTRSERTWAKIHIYLKQDLFLEDPSTLAKDQSDYVVKWGGPQVLWRVIRKLDNTVMKEKLRDKEAAERWLFDFEKAV